MCTNCRTRRLLLDISCEVEELFTFRGELEIDVDADGVLYGNIIQKPPQGLPVQTVYVAVLLEIRNELVILPPGLLEFRHGRLQTLDLLLLLRDLRIVLFFEVKIFVLVQDSLFKVVVQAELRVLQPFPLPLGAVERNQVLIRGTAVTSDLSGRVNDRFASASSWICVCIAFKIAASRAASRMDGHWHLSGE